MHREQHDEAFYCDSEHFSRELALLHQAPGNKFFLVVSFVCHSPDWAPAICFCYNSAENLRATRFFPPAISTGMHATVDVWAPSACADEMMRCARGACACVVFYAADPVVGLRPTLPRWCLPETTTERRTACFVPTTHRLGCSAGHAPFSSVRKYARVLEGVVIAYARDVKNHAAAVCLSRRPPRRSTWVNTSVARNKECHWQEIPLGVSAPK